MSKKIKVYSVKGRCTPKSKTQKNVKFKPAYHTYSGAFADEKNLSKQDIEKSVIKQMEEVLNNDRQDDAIISCRVLELIEINPHFLFNSKS